MKIKLLSLLLVAAAACAQVLYEEGFTDGVAQLSWDTPWGAEADLVSVDWVDGNPAGDGFIGVLHNELSGGGVGTAYVLDNSLTDYTVEAQIYLIPGSSAYRGLIGRAHGNSELGDLEMYALVADLDDDRYRLRRWPGGFGMETLEEWYADDIGDLYPDEEGWYKMGMEFEGDEIRCYINDVQLPGTVINDVIPYGGFGVYLWDMVDTSIDIKFDDFIVDGGTSVENDIVSPADFSLNPNFPNPFNPQTTIPWNQSVSAAVQLEIFDISGRLVKSLIKEDRYNPGAHQSVWDGTDIAGNNVASGLYLSRLEINAEVQTKRMVLLR
jgi:hypothetical protein